MLCRGKLQSAEKLVSSLWNPHSVRPRPPCQFWFWAPRLAVTVPEVPVLCAAVRLGFDTGQSDQSYANGNQMGRESLVDYRRRREACVFMYSYGDLGPLSFLPFLSWTQTNTGSYVCFLHAPVIRAVCDLTDFGIHCQLVNASQIWFKKCSQKAVTVFRLSPF